MPSLQPDLCRNARSLEYKGEQVSRAPSIVLYAAPSRSSKLREHPLPKNRVMKEWEDWIRSGESHIVSGMSAFSSRLA